MANWRRFNRIAVKACLIIINLPYQNNLVMRNWLHLICNHQENIVSLFSVFKFNNSSNYENTSLPHWFNVKGLLLESSLSSPPSGSIRLHYYQLSVTSPFLLPFKMHKIRYKKLGCAKLHEFWSYCKAKCINHKIIIPPLIQVNLV